MKIGMVSLGCPKNLVDSEVMLGLAQESGHQLTGDAADADVLIVNTCAFIDKAKQESIDAILEMAEQKKTGACRRPALRGLHQQLRRGILIALLVDREITQKARMTDAQLRQFYTANQKRFQKPESVWVQSISFNFPEKATPVQRAQARQRAATILPKAKATKSFVEFGQLAEKYSEDDWRIMMGDHRWLHRGRLPSAVEDAAFRMKKEETSEIIETSEAFVIVRVNGKQGVTRIPYSQVSKSLREDMEKAKLLDLRTQFEKQLRSRYKIEELP